MRVLVTGITGFVGGHLAEHLLDAGDLVRGCSRSGTWPDQLNHLASRILLTACDLTDPRAAMSLVRDQDADAIFHLAGLAHPGKCKAYPDQAERDNVAATQNVCEAIRQCGWRTRLVFVGTSYVYGQPRPEDLPIRVDCPIRAEHPYAATKWAAEQVVMRFGSEFGIDTIRVRPFNHTGPRQPAGYIVPDWAMQIAAIEQGRAPHRLHVGNLQTRRDYTDVRDVVRAYRLLAMQGDSGAVYNLGSGSSTSGADIVERLRLLSESTWTVEADQTLMRGTEAPEIVADVVPLCERTGWRPEINLDSTLRDTLDYWREMGRLGRAGANQARRHET